MRRLLKVPIATAAALLIGAFAFAIFAPAGLLSNLATGLANSVLGDQVRVKGLGGSFPDHVTAKELALRDAAGVYATLTNITIDWSPAALFHRTAHIDRLHADRLTLLRLPEKSHKSGGGFSLPLGLDVDALKIDVVALSAAVAGEKAELTLGGAVHLKSLEKGSVDLAAQRIGGAGGRYSISGVAAPDSITARLSVDEPAGGLIATAANLTHLGPLSLHAALHGPRTDETAELALSAGKLRLGGNGTIDIKGHRLDLKVTGSAPAMAPGPGIAWQSARLDARVKGPFAAPDASGTAEIVALRAGAARAARLTAKIAGGGGKVAADAALTGLTLPGPKPDLLAAAPLKIHAEATLDGPGRPIVLAISHPLIDARAEARTEGGVTGKMTLTLPALAPFASAAKLDLQGRLAVNGTFAAKNGTATVSADGTLSVTGGMKAAVATIGRDAHLTLAAHRADGEMRLDKLALDGASLRASANGARTAGGAIRLAWDAALTKLSAVAPTVAGDVTAHGTVEGQPTDLALMADATVDAAVGTLPRQKVTVAAKLHGLPNAPTGTVTAEGRFAGAPVRLAASVARATDGAIRVAVDRANWKSATAHGTLVLPPGATLPVGNMRLRFAKLSDLDPLIGEPVTGSVAAELRTVAANGGPAAQLNATADGVAFAGTEIEKAALDGTIDRLARDRTLDLTLRLDGIRTANVTGHATLTARGAATNPALRLAATLNPPGNHTAEIEASGTADAAHRALRLAALKASWRGKTVRLAGPARISFANGLAVEGLRLEAGQAMLTASGRIAPKLDLTASARNITPKLLSFVTPSAAASEGTMAMTARLGGTLARPTGTLRVTGRGFRGWAESANAPAAGFDATAQLNGTWAAVDASFSAGNTATLRVSGRAPLEAAGTLDLTVAGRTDLALLDPFLLAGGRRARGAVTLDLTASGTLAHPRLAGDARLAGGELQDYTQGVHITDVVADIRFTNGLARIVRFTGRAGPGTVSLAGTIQLLAPGMPVDVTFTAHGAKLPARDLVTAILDADVHLRGNAEERLEVAGKITVERADVQLPDHLPQSVAVLDVRKAGAPPKPPPGPSFLLGLDLTVDAPQQIFVRGHGLDAEMGGSLKITGTTAKPIVTGGFQLRRGSYSIAGKTLQFVSGTVGFDGESLTGNLNPTLDFVAKNTTGSITAQLEITGYADDPKIKLTSSPELPQDEVLAHLLFAKSVNELTPLEIAQIGTALASLGGAGGGFSPLAEVRKGLGLDVLSVGGGGGGKGATVEAGKYVANGVYVGTKEGLGGSSQAQVRIDLTKHLKLDTQVSAKSGGPLTGVTPANDPGSSVGLTYQFDY